MLKTYRIFCFDGAGRIISADWLGAADADEALANAEQSMNCVKIKVWERDRLVCRIGPEEEH